MTAPAEIRVDARGLTFGALSWGDPTGPLALCLHGYPDTAWTWRYLGPHLAERGWRVVAPFTRGYGPTDLAPDDDYTVGAQSRDAVALREVLGDDRSVLIGHDFGAAAAHHVTSATPDRFRRVVTLAVPPMFAVPDAARRPDTLGLFLRQLGRSWYMGFNQLPVLAEGAQDRVIPKLWADWSPGYDGREDIEHVFDALREPGRRRAALRYYRDTLGSRAGIVDAFGITPRQRVLFLHGEDDGCVGTDITRRRLDLMAPGSRAEYLDGVGHFLHLERPDLVNPLVTEWIEDDQAG